MCIEENERLAHTEQLVETLKRAGLDSNDIEPLVIDSFLAYKYRKQNKKLYTEDGNVPTRLIKLYYGLGFNDSELNIMKRAFVTHYIRNESKLEGLDIKDYHQKCEVEGLEIMYEFIHSSEIEQGFNIFSTLLRLHEKLFSKTPFPEAGGKFRNQPAYLPGSGVDLCPHDSISDELFKYCQEVDNLREIANIVKLHDDMDALFNYMDKCIELNCALIKIHPFIDGNGRVVRGFTNKLFEDAGLPPVYIKPNERAEYHKAMSLAINENDYTAIKNFYRYKVCDTIIELDINNRVRTENQENYQKKK
ncbi:MAG: Fic family protein [bacterium]|nr:Fic family protein [bacterium]